MIDTSNNVTLEEINYESSEVQSLSAISEIRYTPKYNYLNNISFSGDHLELSKINIQPSNNQYNVKFLQNILETQTQNQFDADQTKNQNEIGKLICSPKKDIKGPIRLPISKSSLYLQVQSKSNLMRGKLRKESGNSEIMLFDKQGKEKGRFSYHLQKKCKGSDIINELVDDNTLQQKDFKQDAPAKKRGFNKEVKNHIDVQSRVTLKSSSHELNKNTQTTPVISQYEDQEKSQKSQIDYMGYEESNLQIQKRISDYKCPLNFQSLPKADKKKFDYQSIRRSMNELGLSHVNQIERFLNGNHPISDQIVEEQSQQSTINIEGVPSHQDMSAQAEERKPQLVQQGMGTYTPLPSRLKNNSSASNRKQQFPQKSRKQSYQLEAVVLRQQDQARQKPYEMVRPQFIRSKGRQRDSSQELESSKESIIRNLVSSEKSAQLSLRNKVYQIKLGSSRLNARVNSEESKRNEWSSYKQSRQRIINISSQSENESLLYPDFDLCINNFSVNFHKKSFGVKFAQVSIPPTTYRTQQLSGNNLIFISKSYLFKRINANDELSLSVKKVSTQNTQETLGQVKIKISDILLNRKKSYFQTFLLSRQSVMAIVIVGFELTNKFYEIPKQVPPIKIARQTHAQTQFSKSKTTKIKRKSSKKKEDKQHYGNQKLPSPRENPIRMRKYLGGRNIKIGKASRFLNDSIQMPGPGNYQIQSSFSRHAQKDY